MSLSPRLLDLLDRYPDELDDDELATLRAAADADPRLDRALTEALTLDAALDALDAPPTELSELGQARLRKALDAARGDDPKAWGSPPAAPLEAKADNVVSLFARRPVQLALAALLLVALGFAARDLLAPADDPYDGGIKGDPTDVELQLVVRGADSSPVSNGDARPADAPVRFHVRVEDPGIHLALLEIQGSTSAVVWPAPGAVWPARVGINLLQPPGASPDYTPATFGEATYVAFAAKEPLVIPAQRIREADLRAANPHAATSDPFTILWTSPAPP